MFKLVGEDKCTLKYCSVTSYRYGDGDYVDKIIFGYVYWPHGSSTVFQYKKQHTHQHDELRFDPLDLCVPSKIKTLAYGSAKLTELAIHYMVQGKIISSYNC